jgi:hypothetical protein
MHLQMVWHMGHSCAFGCSQRGQCCEVQFADAFADTTPRFWELQKKSGWGFGVVHMAPRAAGT